jgi:hypothetical protein
LTWSQTTPAPQVSLSAPLSYDDEQDDETIMPRKPQPTEFKRAYLHECFDVLSAEPPVIRWRTRPMAHFGSGYNLTSEAAARTWNKANAGQVIRPQLDGRLRVRLTGPDGVSRILDARTIIAEIGVTLIGVQQMRPDDPSAGGC